MLRRLLDASTQTALLILHNDETLYYATPAAAALLGFAERLDGLLDDEALRHYRDALKRRSNVFSLPLGGELLMQCERISIDHEYFILARIEAHESQTLLQERIEALEALLQSRTESFEAMLYTDPVTLLRTRHALLEEIGKSAMPTLFLIDIQDYNRYLDLYGTAIGEAIQQMFAQMLQAVAQPKEYLLYHLKSDLFAMLHPSDYIDTPKYEADLFELLDTVLENPLYIPAIDDTLFIDITVGFASGNDNLLNHAYDALGKAKSTRKRYVYFHPFHNRSDEHRQILQVKKEIQESIERGDFLPVFQAITDRERRIIKYEVLIRMRQEGKLVSPGYFLDIAAKTNQYEQISQNTLLLAIDAFRSRTETLSLNFSQLDINNKELLRTLEQRLRSYNMAKRVIFEIVESDAIDNYEAIRTFVARFRRIGVRFAIDDFGSGYANFAHIMELEPDYLKIDGSLVKDLLENQRSFLMVNSIIQFAHDLGITVIAEFVSSAAIFDALHAMGVDEFQGFYLGKPEPLSDTVS
ncbi:MAG: GGDEF domain-containing protein [Campylobacterales bacterium]|nr:GGDEF domain-containing protein [Campylobacterales bacterium]